MNIFRKNLEKEESLQAQIADIESQYEALKLENDKLIEQNKSLIEEIAQLQQSNEQLEETVEENVEVLEEIVEEVKEIAETQETVEIKAANKAVEIINAVAQPTVEIVPDESELDLEQNKVSVIEQMKTLTGKELNEFFLKNKNEIYKALKK